MEGLIAWLGFLYIVGIAIALIVYKFLSYGKEYQNKQVPHKLVVKRNQRCGILLWGYVLFPGLPILFSPTFWGLGLFIVFIFGVFGLGKYIGTTDKKTWDYYEWTRINDPELYKQWAREARAQAKRDAAKRTARGAGAFAAGYIAGKKTEL